MKKIIFLLFLTFTITSCSILKTKKTRDLTTKTKTLSVETGEVLSKRQGDTLTYTVLNPILKDTTIYVKNKEKQNSNTLRISYDKSGLQNIQCISDDINELKRYIKEVDENKTEEIKETEKIKETNFKPIFILYVFLGFAFLIILFRVLKKFGF